jgi:CIC family chloride channel protein
LGSATPMFYLIPIVTTVGGLCSGILVYGLAPEAEGHGTDAAIDAFHNKKVRFDPEYLWLSLLHQR